MDNTQQKASSWWHNMQLNNREKALNIRNKYYQGKSFSDLSMSEIVKMYDSEITQSEVLICNNCKNVDTFVGGKEKVTRCKDCGEVSGSISDKMSSAEEYLIEEFKRFYPIVFDRQETAILMESFAQLREEQANEQIKNIIENFKNQFSEEYKQKLIKKFMELYGDRSLNKEKANSFAVGFSKAWDIILTEYTNNKLLADGNRF